MTRVPTAIAFGTAVSVLAGVATAQTPAGGPAPAAPATAGRGATPTPPTCGPNTNPAGPLASAAKDSRCFEIRTYVVQPEGPGSLDLLHKRFRDYTLGFFKKHGFTVIGLWQPVNKTDTLVYMLAFANAAARDSAWAAFNADPDWQKARTELNVRLQVTSEFVVATNYSPLK
ncbi:MAG: NIPSNAP family protein [Vicinamibacterales bacterium]